MAMKLPPGLLMPDFFTRLQKYLKWLDGSMVPPDLLAKMNRVRFRSSCPRTESIQAGSVVSSTKRRGYFGFWKTPRITSGARLEPPIPSSTAWVKPAARISSANSSISLTFGSILKGMSSQPSAPEICFPAAASFFQSPASFSQSLAAKFIAASFLTAAEASIPVSSSFMVFSCPVAVLGPISPSPKRLFYQAGGDGAPRR